MAGRGRAAASVAIDPAPFRGGLPLPISALQFAFPVPGNPASRHRAVPLTYDQFRYAFANAVCEDEAKQLNDTSAVPASGRRCSRPRPQPQPLDRGRGRYPTTPDRGPLLVISGEQTTPWRGPSPTPRTSSRRTMTGSPSSRRSRTGVYALTIDNGWRAVADTALVFINRFVA